MLFIFENEAEDFIISFQLTYWPKRKALCKCVLSRALSLFFFLFFFVLVRWNHYMRNNISTYSPFQSPLQSSNSLSTSKLTKNSSNQSVTSSESNSETEDTASLGKWNIVFWGGFEKKLFVLVSYELYYLNKKIQNILLHSLVYSLDHNVIHCFTVIQWLNPFAAKIPILYPPKTSENPW